MTESQFFSILGCLFVLLTMSLQSGIVFSWSAIGVFYVTNLIFVCTGILIMPWILEQMPLWFPTLNTSLFTQQDFILATVLTVGGGALVLFFYQFSHFIFSGGKLYSRPPCVLQTVLIPKLGFYRWRLLFISAIGLFVSIAFVYMNRSVFIEGIREGFLGGDPALVIEARKGATASYLFSLLVYNVMPFLAVGLWLLYRYVGGAFRGTYAMFFIVVAACLLVLTFEKRPLIIFLGSVFLANLKTGEGWGSHAKPLKKRAPGISKKKVIIYGIILFSILLVLYYFHTKVGKQLDNTLDIIEKLFQMALVRIFGRLATPSIMYAHYFPDVEPYFGISNIGLLSKIFGYQHISANEQVFNYFNIVDPLNPLKGGTTASCALVDFYGGFGIIGWIAGCAFLGFMFERMDLRLARVKADVSKILLVVFMFVFVYYLSQASLFRSLLGYGGGMFVLLWILLKLRLA